MKNLSLLMAAALTAGCATSITAPQDITDHSEIDRQYTLYNHSLGTPTIEMRSFFDVDNVIVNKNKELELHGNFSIVNKRYQTDSKAVAVFDIELVNLGNDQVMISELEAKDLSLFSVHKPIESSVYGAFKDMTLMLTNELSGEIINGQTRLAIANKVNEIVKRK